ncbi:MAG: division/cell wall cluster transcriptional repressor MraZ [Paracoccaceae bacterium]
MLKHFTGTHDHKVDDKGRVSLPTEFRRVLDAVGSSGALYIVPQLDSQKSHVVFTTEAYSNLIERHNARDYPSYGAQQRMELKLVTRASQIQVDDNGRIVIAKPLREMIGLTKNIRFVGVASSFEIWQPEARDDFEAALLSELDEGEDPFIDRRGLH